MKILRKSTVRINLCLLKNNGLAYIVKSQMIQVALNVSRDWQDQKVVCIPARIYHSFFYKK